MKANWKRILITGFILLNVFAIPFSSSEPPSRQNAVQRFFLPYLTWTRLLQSWPLFCPSPRKFALKYRVDITFRDGKKATWERPYPPNWDFFQRHLSYNYQKWDLAAGYLEDLNDLRVDLAVHVARLYWNETNPPVILKLIRSTANWPPPHETGYVQHDVSELNWVDVVILSYNVPEKGPARD